MNKKSVGQNYLASGVEIGQQQNHFFIAALIIQLMTCSNVVVWSSCSNCVNFLTLLLFYIVSTFLKTTPSFARFSVEVPGR